MPMKLSALQGKMFFSGEKAVLAIFLMHVFLAVILSNTFVQAADLKGADQNLSGAWFDQPVVAEQNCYGLLLLFADRKFAMRECLEDRTLCQITDTSGEWTYRGKVLKLTVSKQAKFTSKWHEYDANTECGGCCYDNVKPVVKLFSPPHLKSFSCILEPGGPDPSAEHGSHCWEMMLNGKRYWKFNDEIENYVELISLAKEVCPK